MKHYWILGIIVILMTSLLTGTGYGREAQNTDRLYDELMTIYLGNLARRDHGVPPLRANVQLTRAARWFAWDSVENRHKPYCGHQDSRGFWPDYRAREYGYPGMAGAENAFCGYVSPADAIQGWLDSSGHRANLLCDCHREIGLGFYRGGDRGYVAQMFGYDPVYPPVIIEHEALTTTTPQVGLYIYSASGDGDMVGMGAAVEMLVSNNPSFADALWEPYTAEKRWTLEPGTGWRTVYVKTRDHLGRAVTVSDTIYLGETLPRAELSDVLMSTTQSEITITGTDQSGWPQVQFSTGWLADDSFDLFNLWWGNGERVQDPDAMGNTAFRLEPGDGESFAWFSTTGFIKDQPLVAYFRLKASDNTTTSEIARIAVEGAQSTYGPLHLTGRDFAATNVYQEFALPFTFPTDPEHPFLNIKVWRSGSADVIIDTVTIFTASQPVQDTLTWVLPGGNYRGQGIQARYTDEQGGFSAIMETSTKDVVTLPKKPVDDEIISRVYVPLLVR